MSTCGAASEGPSPKLVRGCQDWDLFAYRTEPVLHGLPYCLALLAVSTGKKVSGAAAQQTVNYPDNLTYRGE